MENDQNLYNEFALNSEKRKTGPDLAKAHIGVLVC
jgi:hypothetical protein